DRNVTGVQTCALPILFVINQFILLYQFLSLLHPILAIIVLSVIGIGILYFIYSITKQLLKSPKVLELEDDATEEEYDEYIDKTQIGRASCRERVKNGE